MKTSKTTPALTAAIIVCLLFSSCCKMYCENNMISVSFENYRVFETDTVYMVSYERSSNFTARKDSFAYILPNVASDTSRQPQIRSIHPDKDWKIRVPSLNKEFRISDYEVVSAECECGPSKYGMIKSYKLNGNNETTLYLRLPR